MDLGTVMTRRSDVRSRFRRSGDAPNVQGMHPAPYLPSSPSSCVGPVIPPRQSTPLTLIHPLAPPSIPHLSHPHHTRTCGGGGSFRVSCPTTLGRSSHGIEN